MNKSLSGPEVPVRDYVSQLSSKSQYDRTTALAALLKMTQDSTGMKRLKQWKSLSGNVVLVF